jgi:response regulator RpfG family c-di-GMP phosphodiesterase
MAQENSKPTVLIVDDEEMVVTSIRAFLRLDTDYDVRGFTDPEEAVRCLESCLTDVVIADYVMPRMNGIQFLARAKQLQPEATRVLLTGYADKQSAIQAINELSLFQYLEKPWDNAALLLVIQSGVERSQLFRQLREKIAELDAAHSNVQEIQRRLFRAFM